MDNSENNSSSNLDEGFEEKEIEDVSDSVEEVNSVAESAEIPVVTDGESFSAANTDETDYAPMPDGNENLPEGAAAIDASGVFGDDENETHSKNEGRKSKRLLIFSGVAVFAAVILAAVLIVMQTPEKALAKARKATQSDYQAVLDNAFFTQEKKYIELKPQTEIDYSFTLNSISAMNGMPLLFLNGANISGSVNLDNDAKMLDMGLSTSLKDEEIVSLNINLDNGYLSANVPELIGDKYISVDFKTIVEDIQNNPMAGMLGIPEYDYEAFTDGIFGITGKINEMNKTYEEATGSGLLTIIASELDSALDGETGNRMEVKKGDNAEVEGIKYKTFETGFYAEAVQDVFRNSANEFLDGFEQGFGDYFANVEDSLPGYYSGYSEQVLSYVQAMRDGIDKITFDEPVIITYYVDGKNKIRRSVYTTTVGYEGQQCEIVLETYKNGESNIYDSIDANLTLSVPSGSISLEWLSDGDHADKDVFTDKSRISLSYSDNGRGESDTLTVDSTLLYEASDNRTKMDMEYAMASLPYKLALGYDMKVEANEAEYKSKTVFDNVYIELPGFKVAFAMSYGSEPSAESPKSKEQLNSAEILKMDSEDLYLLSEELSNNFITLQQKVLELFGNFNF